LHPAPSLHGAKRNLGKHREAAAIDEEIRGPLPEGAHNRGGQRRPASEEDEGVYDPSVLLGQMGVGSQEHGEQGRDDAYDVMYDILVEPNQAPDTTAYTSTKELNMTSNKSAACYQRTASQDRLDLLDNHRDRTEVPSINGGLPITMQVMMVKKEPGFLHGGYAGTLNGTGSNVGQILSSGTSSTALSQLKHRRPFSPPLK